VKQARSEEEEKEEKEEDLGRLSIYGKADSIDCRHASILLGAALVRAISPW
jgi:hypothetical protein